MANIEGMLNLQNLGSPSQLSATGSVIGGVVGTAFGQPILGSVVGAGIGTVAGNLIPSYTHIKGSVSGVNFVALNLKPYMITLVEPTDDTAKNISDYYCYFGCKTKRLEALNIPDYMYQGHAYVQGLLQYNGSIPLDKFQKLQSIFANGVHILNE